jgi:hypothetical protein
VSDDDDGGKIDAVSENVVFGTNPKALLLRGRIHAVLTANDVLEHAKRHNITSEQTNGAVVVMAAAAQVWNGVGVCGVMTCWREMCTCHILIKAVN